MLIRNYKWLLVLALVLIGVLAIRYYSATKVEVVKATRGPAVEGIYATGTVEAAIMLPIATRTMARLKTLNVDEGADVVENQVLAELESEDVLSALSAARAKEAFAKAEYERNDELFAKRAVSQQAIERAKADWDVAKAAIVEAQAKSDFLKLLAPAAGQIIRRDGEVGQLIPANQAVFWISVVSPLRISAEVDEEDISRVVVDQKVVVRADAFPGRVFQAKVSSITPKGDPIARSYRVRIEFTEETPLQIGMTAETNIIVSQRQDALLIPSSAVVKGKVLIVVNSYLEQRDVTIGAHGLEKIEILSGLAPDDLIVLRPSNLMAAGQRVQAFRNPTN